MHTSYLSPRAASATSPPFPDPLSLFAPAHSRVGLATRPRIGPGHDRYLFSQPCFPYDYLVLVICWHVDAFFPVTSCCYRIAYDGVGAEGRGAPESRVAVRTTAGAQAVLASAITGRREEEAQRISKAYDKWKGEVKKSESTLWIGQVQTEATCGKLRDAGYACKVVGQDARNQESFGGARHVGPEAVVAKSIVARRCFVHKENGEKGAEESPKALEMASERKRRRQTAKRKRMERKKEAEGERGKNIGNVKGASGKSDTEP